jgi:nucleotide-binding universal stress UspA family protein
MSDADRDPSGDLKGATFSRFGHAVMVDDTPAQGSVSPRWRHVLVPLDGSALAAAALPTARALAQRLGADVQTISVAATEEEVGGLRVRAREQLGGERSDATGVVVDADPATAIRRRCGEIGNCLLCMSSRGHGRLVGAVVGSVARAVLSSSSEPLVVVGPHADRPTALVRSGSVYRRPPSWPAPLSRGGVVACVDGTPSSEVVLPVAAAWARAFDMTLTVLTVAEDVRTPVGVGAAWRRRFGPDHPEEYVARLADAVRGGNPAAAGLVVYDPIGVASGVQAYLASEPAALVALATHARSGLERVRFGATGAELVRISTAPAVVIPSSS